MTVGYGSSSEPPLQPQPPSKKVRRPGYRRRVIYALLAYAAFVALLVGAIAVFVMMMKGG